MLYEYWKIEQDRIKGLLSIFGSLSSFGRNFSLSTIILLFNCARMREQLIYTKTEKVFFLSADTYVMKILQHHCCISFPSSLMVDFSPLATVLYGKDKHVALKDKRLSSLNFSIEFYVRIYFYTLRNLKWLASATKKNTIAQKNVRAQNHFNSPRTVQQVWLSSFNHQWICFNFTKPCQVKMFGMNYKTELW